MSEKQTLDLLVKEMLGELDTNSRREMIASVRSVLHEAMFELSAIPSQDYPCCPHCGSVEIVKKGKSRDGSQRYLCKDCERTFGQSTNRPLALSKLDGSVWMAYAECFVDMLPLREAAKRCHVSLRTSFTMRHRILRTLEERLPRFRSGNGMSVELDETYFPESFKGNHTKDGFVMPRRAHKRGHSVRVRGLSQEQICVASGINDCGDSFFALAGRGNLSAKRALDVLDGIVEAGSKVRTDKSRAYKPALKELGVSVHERIDSQDRTTGVINRVNTLHANLSHFMTGFRGVSTKHLHSYLSWFVWVDNFGRNLDVSERVIEAVSDSFDRNRRKDYLYQPYPYMEYWERCAA